MTEIQLYKSPIKKIVLYLKDGRILELSDMEEVKKWQKIQNDLLHAFSAFVDEKSKDGLELKWKTVRGKYE